MPKKCPCKGCVDRRLTCHGFCRQYKDWQKENQAEKEWLREQNWTRTENQRDSFFAMMRKKAKGIIRTKGGRGNG